MPFNKDTLPEWLKGLPDPAIALGGRAFDSAMDQVDDEEQAMRSAMAAVMSTYQKNDGLWSAMKGPRGETLDAVLVHMSVGVDAPSEFLIFPFGTVTGAKMEPIKVDAESVASVRAYHEKMGNDMVIDYEHQTLYGQIAPAAGWIKEFYDGGGLCCRSEWTAKAREYIKNREYRYFSPVALLDERRHLIGVNTMALTNSPRGHNLTPLVMSLSTAGGAVTSIKQKEKSMLKEVLALLGLPADTTEGQAIVAMSTRLKAPAAQEVMSALKLKPEATAQEVCRAINDLQIPVVACKEVMSELGLQQTAGASEVIATIRAIKQAQANGVSAVEFEAMKNKIVQREADDLVSEAMKAGKITAAQKDWATKYAREDQEGFKLFVERAPVVISMKTITDTPPKRDAMSDLTQEDREVMKQFELSEEDFKKFYKPAA